MLLNLCCSSHVDPGSRLNNDLEKQQEHPKVFLTTSCALGIISPLCLQCEFLNDEAPTPQVFSSGPLQVAACDLKQLMATFHHVYDTELRVYCNREPPRFSSDTQVFHRVHHLLLALNTVRTCTRPSSAAPPPPH